MFIIVGGTGRVGSATATELLAQGHRVTIVTRDAKKSQAWREHGADLAEVDIRDVPALRRIFQRGRRAFLLNPPAPPSTDKDREELSTVHALLEALNDSGLEKVVAQSTYGARSGEGIGDLTVLHELEEGLRRQSIPATIMRAAYMMSNWDQAIGSASDTGELLSMLPRDFGIPMVAPKDLGAAAARFLQEPPAGVAVTHVEGPRRYTPADVAEVLTKALQRPVEVDVVPRNEFEETYKKFGFSEKAAQSYARMTRLTIDGLELPSSPHRTNTTIEEYVLNRMSS